MEWVRNPQVKISVQHGKGAKVVTGVATLTFVDDRVLFSTDGAHINDNTPAVDFNGESWLVRLSLARDGDGVWALERDAHQSVTRRATWSEAPKSFRAAIVAAAQAAVTEHWTEDLARQVRYARAAQDLHRAEPELVKAQAEVDRLTRTIAELRQALADNAPQEVAA